MISFKTTVFTPLGIICHNIYTELKNGQAFFLQELHQKIHQKDQKSILLKKH